jgi:hypothetical protein
MQDSRHSGAWKAYPSVGEQRQNGRFAIADSGLGSRGIGGCGSPVPGVIRLGDRDQCHVTTCATIARQSTPQRQPSSIGLYPDAQHHQRHHPLHHAQR